MGRGSKCQGMKVKYKIQGSHNSLQKGQLHDLGKKCTQLYYVGKHSLNTKHAYTVWTQTEGHILKF